MAEYRRRPVDAWKQAGHSFTRVGMVIRDTSFIVVAPDLPRTTPLSSQRATNPPRRRQEPSGSFPGSARPFGLRVRLSAMRPTAGPGAGENRGFTAGRPLAGVDVIRPVLRPPARESLSDCIRLAASAACCLFVGYVLAVMSFLVSIR